MSIDPKHPPPTAHDIEERLRQAGKGASARWFATARLALTMMFHDKPKLIGTVVGVVFAVVLAAQQLGILLGLLHKNTMLVDNAGADIWITPAGTKQIQPGKLLSESVLVQARSTAGVAVASPLIYGTGAIQRPWGGSEAITIVGAELPHLLGGPWNIVAGEAAVLAQPDVMFFEDSRRDKLGGINLGSVREVNGYQVRVGGFTWGLLAFAPPYSFAEVELARTLLGTPTNEQHFVLIKVEPGSDTVEVARNLAARLPEVKVMTRQELHDSIVSTLLSEQLGITFGTSTAFGLIIGFIIVALSMFSSVLDNLREFGTLKAIGVTNGDLSRLLVVQSIAYALIGSFVGLGIVGFVAEGIRSANLAVIVPWQIMAGAPAVMTVLCVCASALALRRVRRLEPGMVFR